MARPEPVGGGVEIWVSEAHTFGMDACLLSHFALPRRHEVACDLGTGCGAVPLLWFREHGARAPRVTFAVDIQPEALELAARSAERSGLRDCIRPLLADLRGLRDLRPKPEGFQPGAFHLVTCNPPYYAEGSGRASADHNRRTARHEASCTLGDVCAAAAYLLRPGGRFCLCHLPARLPDVLCAMRAHRLEPKRLRMVQRTAGDAPWLVLVEGRRNARPQLAVESPFIFLEPDGRPSVEARLLGSCIHRAK